MTILDMQETSGDAHVYLSVRPFWPSQGCFLEVSKSVAVIPDSVTWLPNVTCGSE
jgi:hypothetical protein